MFYWTFLVITLGGPFNGYASVLPYKGIEACNAAMNVVPQTLGMEVAMVQCRQTDVAGWTVRPKKRPEGLNG